ncbi:MAG TPA: cytochrome P450 [Solirubrobacteraceae bacterium]|jgi:cytochrome P450|nr:cytochrome P450 [Solirubrobacteraceae bacterium]
MGTAATTSPAVAGSATGLPAGPRWPMLGQTLAQMFVPTWMMDRCAARYGDTFTLTLPPGRTKYVFISDPEAVKALFSAAPEMVVSATSNLPPARVFGPASLFTLNGPEHIRQRRLLLPPFHGERMRKYGDVIVEATRRDMATWPLGRPMRMLERTRAITLEVILRAVFGVEGEQIGALRSAIERLFVSMSTGRLLLVGLSRAPAGPPKGAIGRAQRHLDEVIYAEIAHRRTQADLEEREDILSLLLQAHDEEGQPMTDGELRDELVTLLLAGYETTAAAVAWAIERLTRHPHELARLVAEIAAGQGERYMLAVIHETLRVRPVVPVVIRVLREPMRVGDRELPRGTGVGTSIYLTNRNPRTYEAPGEFRPERFLDSQPETFSWIPFGGGIRRCIGASFATHEMKSMLSTVLGELHPSLPRHGGRLFRTGEWNRRNALLLAPAGGARVVWSPR